MLLDKNGCIPFQRITCRTEEGDLPRTLLRDKMRLSGGLLEGGGKDGPVSAQTTGRTAAKQTGSWLAAWLPSLLTDLLI